MLAMAKISLVFQVLARCIDVRVVGWGDMRGLAGIFYHPGEKSYRVRQVPDEATLAA
jgi:hypothetical protein